MARMAGSQRGQAIPTQLSLAQFEAFVLPHLSRGSRGPAPKLGLHKIFNYILRLLYMGCQWKELPIKKDGEGRPEIHHTRIYSAFRRWDADGCMDAIFTGSVLRASSGQPPRYHGHPRRWHDDGSEKERRQHWLQRAQESEGRQGRRLLRPQLQCDRAVCFSPGQPQRIPTASRSPSKVEAHCQGGWLRPSRT